jgi:hypothetical protein
VPLYRSDQALIYVEVSGVTLDKEPWSEFEGGDPQVTSVPAFPGGMKPLVELGDFPKPSPITVGRPWSDVLAAAYKAIYRRAGIGEAKVSYQLLSASKEPVGEVFSFTGILGTPTRPGYKAGTSEEAMLKLVINPHGEIG